MIEIGDKIVSIDLLTTRFCCDLNRCKGICCVEGNAGAPLEESEVEILEREYENYKPYMKKEGIEAVERDGFMIVDDEGDYTTPLINDSECAFSYERNGITFCAIERAYKENKTTFIKPISCHLYPVRLVKFSNGTTGLNYHRWGVCSSALECGKAKETPMYQSLKIPLVRHFGRDFFDALVEAEKYIKELG